MTLEAYKPEYLAVKKAGAQVVATGKPEFIFPDSGRLISVRSVCGTAPTGATLIHDVNLDGTTIFTTQANRPTIAIAGTESTETAPDVTEVAAGQVITVDIDQIGSGTAGSDALIVIKWVSDE